MYDQYIFPCFTAKLLDFYAHAAETVDGRKTVGTVQKSVYDCVSLGDRAEHYGSVGYGFVSGNGECSAE